MQSERQARVVVVRVVNHVGSRRGREAAMIERDQDALDVLRGSQEQALDAAVPIRTSPKSLGEVSKDPRPELDPRAALVLLHADGVSSIAEIAS